MGKTIRVLVVGLLALFVCLVWAQSPPVANQVAPLQVDVASTFSAQTTPAPTSWSVGGIFAVTKHGAKWAGQGVACVFNDFGRLTKGGKPTVFYWSGFLGTTVDAQGHAAGGVGLSIEGQAFDQIGWRVFLGAQYEGGSSLGPAIGASLDIKF